MNNIVILLTLFVWSYFFIWCFKFYALKHNLIDHPNQRSSHSIPKIRGAGISFVILWLLYILYMFIAGFISLRMVLVFVPGALLIAVIGFVDDHKSVAAKWRFLGYLLAVIISLIVLGGFPYVNLEGYIIHWGLFGSILAIICVVWSINLYNFMDGIDGIAAIEAVFVFGVGGYFLWHVGGFGLAMLAWALVALVLGFLIWNFPPAKIFMGDVGSAFLGFLVVIFAITGEKGYNVASVLWLMLYGVFVFDATVTLIRRILRGEKWYVAHKQHAYQRLQLKNWSHRKILLGVFVVNVILAIMTLIAYYHPQYFVRLFIMEIVLLTVIYLAIEKVQPMLKTSGRN